jgi:predicted ester cyclase
MTSTAWDALCTPDMVLDPGFTEPICGLAAIKHFTAGLHGAFALFSLRIDDLLAEGEIVVARMTSSGTHTGPLASPAGTIPPTGKAMAMSGNGFYRIARGKITKERVLMDVLGAMQQLGVTPGPGR